MNFQAIWKKSKKALALLLAITLFFGSWGNYDFSVQASGDLAIKLSTDELNVVYSGKEYKLPAIVSVKDGDKDVKEYSSEWTVKKEGASEAVVVDEKAVTDAGIYVLTVKELASDKFTDAETGETGKTETGREGSVAFVVETLDFNECKVLTEEATFTGGETKPQKVVVLNKYGEEIPKDLYSLGYDNNINVGEAAVIAKAVPGNPNVVGETKATFKITPFNLASCNMELSFDSETYTGSEIKPDVTLTFQNQPVDKTFYQIGYTDNVKAGKAKVTVKPAEGNKNIIGEITKTFTIDPKKLTIGMVAITPTEKTVTGENFKDKIEIFVKDNDVDLNAGGDYEVSIPDMVEGDDYEITVTGKGNYAGTVPVSFRLLYATDGAATISGNTLATTIVEEVSYVVYADSVSINPLEGYMISETVSGNFNDKITYNATPEDYIVYIKNTENNEITEFELPKFIVDTEVPTLTVTGPEADSDWAATKEIAVDAAGADYGVYYTTEKQELASPINAEPTGMIRLTDGAAALTVEDEIFEETTYYFYAIDKAGHVTTAEATVNKVDTSAPELTVNGNDANLDDENVYWKSRNDLVFGVKVNDQENLSGLKEIIVETEVSEGYELDCTVEEAVLNANGTLTIKKAGTYTVKVVDMAGNESDVHTIEVKEDTKAPEVKLSAPEGADQYLDGNGVYWFSEKEVNVPFIVANELGEDETETAPYTVTYATNASFILSDTIEMEKGVDAATLPVELIAGNLGKTTLFFKVKDAAGNTSELQHVTVAYDNTQPEITEAVITQTGADEWINFQESGAENQTKVEFAVTAKDAESGIREFEYRSNANDDWHPAMNVTEANGTYTFVTEEAYEDGIDYVWQVRTVNNVANENTEATVSTIAHGSIDTVAPSDEVYIRFLTDVTGANEEFDKENGNWSELQLFLKEAWNKIWGRTEIAFEVYVKDETSGMLEMPENPEEAELKPISMSYDGTPIKVLEKVEGVKAFTDAEDLKQNGFIIYEGKISCAEGTDLAVQNFQIDSLTDVAGNTRSNIVLGNAEDAGIIYLDSVAPKVTSVTINDIDVTEESTYLYNADKNLVITIDERFFAEGVAEEKLPLVEVYAKGMGDEDFEKVDDANVEWTANGVGTIALLKEDGDEVQYQVKMTYNDLSGNHLATDAKLGVQDGQFVSKIFIIDSAAPVLEKFEVTGSGCFVNGTSILTNNVDGDDFVVNFTIDASPDEKLDSLNDLVVKIFKKGEETPVATLTMGEGGLEADNDKIVIGESSVEGRDHNYSFSYDGTDKTQDQFYVTIEYTDKLGHPLEKSDEVAGTIDTEKGFYTSEGYIIDHVAPVFDITYSDAANVVKEGVTVENQKKPLAGHTAYYNEDIIVKFSINEEYYNEVGVDAVEQFVIELKKDGNVIPADITWEHEEEIHTATFTIAEDIDKHTTDGDYQFVVKYQDCATNKMVAENDSNESNKAGVYSSPILVMDTTAPKVKTSYANADRVRTDTAVDYFNSTDTDFVITVVDRNIRYKELKDVLLAENNITAVNVDGDKVDITALMADIEAIKGTEIQHANGEAASETWEKVLSLDAEANYTIKVGFTDLAGNAAVITPAYEKNAVEGNEYVELVTVDKTDPSSEIYVNFTGDIAGERIADSVIESTDDRWVSKILGFVIDSWNKLWGKQVIGFQVYVRDEISGDEVLEMSFSYDANGQKKTDPLVLTREEVVYLNVDDAGVATVATESEGTAYVKYTGELNLSELEIGTDVSVSQFAIKELKDKAFNTLENIEFNENILFFDTVAPKLNVAITDENGENVETDIVENARYFYGESKALVLTIDERFFGAEDTPVYPKYTLVTNGVEGEETEGEWKNVEGTTQYTLTIPLAAVDGEEVEYQVKLTYADAAENKLVSATEENKDVVDGTFTSKIFVIDQRAPKLAAYSVATTDCDVNNKSVLANTTQDNDLVVEFTIDDNPTYYAYADNHAYSYENLEVKLYKTGDENPIATLKDTNGKFESDNKDVAATEKITVDGRNHSYKFSYDIEDNAQGEFYVTIGYKDIMEYPMVSDVTPGTINEDGLYESEGYIIDHVAPAFDITYSDAANVVKEGVTVVNQKKPLAGHTAYYNGDIHVEFTINEKYYNAVGVDAVEQFVIELTKDGDVIPADLKWEHEGEKHTATFTIAEDLDAHTTDGDYQFVVKYQDCATNKMVAENDSNESNEAGVYSSPILVMDTTAPEVKTSYVNAERKNDIDGIDYFNTTSTDFVITVVDRNIRYKELKDVLLAENNITAVNVDGDKVDITALMADIEAIKETEIQHANAKEGTTPETWEKVLSLDAEANYTIKVGFTDLAGNVAVITPAYAEKAVEGNEYVELVTVDATEPSDKLFIEFTSDVLGENNTELSVEEPWHSRIMKFASDVWNKIWGNEKITFKIYARDEVAGLHELVVTYNTNNGKEAVPVTVKWAETDAADVVLKTEDNEATVAEEGTRYKVYSGEFTLDKEVAEDLAITDLQISRLEDRSTNAAANVSFDTIEANELIYLDAANPKLAAVTIDGDPVDKEARYFYKKSKELKLTIDERFFGLEDEPVYPSYKLITVNKTTGETKTEDVSTNKDSWDPVEGTNQYTLTVDLDLMKDAEVEYQVELSYVDAAGNVLVNGSDDVNGVENGTFRSKTFVIDNVAPKLTAVTIDGDPVDEEARYFYGAKKEIKLTIDERYFGGETNPVYPSYQLIAVNKTTGDTNPVDPEDIPTNNGRWEPVGTNQYTLTVDLEQVEGAEVEYQVVLSYADAAGNVLVNGSNDVNGVEDGTFRSKTFVIDNVAPILANVVIDGKTVDESTRYFYNAKQKVEITIDERYFGGETNPVYPSYTFIDKNVVNGTEVDGTPTEISTSEKDWIQVDGTNLYTLTIDLAEEQDQEKEYQVELSYADAAGNNLVNGENINGVKNGTFESKLFAIDQLSPELVAYSVVTSECDVQNASVLTNNTEADDLVVNFTIDDNPTYYKKVVDGKAVNHATSQDNLLVTLYKEAEVIATLTVDDEGNLVSTNLDVKCEVLEPNGRNHSYKISYDGYLTDEKNITEDKFQVTVGYKDVVEHPMVDVAETVKPGNVENGVYTSEEYIIDHVASVFGIDYSAATNVVTGTRYHSKENTVNVGGKPVAGSTAYYNKDIEVTFTIDEKYYNVDGENALEHFEISVYKDFDGNFADDKKIETPEIAWTHTDRVHTGTFVIPADLEGHETDGDYQFVITYNDCATNKMVAENDSNESKEVGVYKSPILVMDTTAPVLTDISYNTIDKFNKVNGRDYVNADTTITFELDEHNPTSTSAYSINSINEDDCKNGTVDWSTASDSSTTSITVGRSGDYGDNQTTTLTIVDWAGNTAKLNPELKLRSSENTSFNEETGTFTDNFTVDDVSPVITLEYIRVKGDSHEKRVPTRENILGVDYFSTQNEKTVLVKVTVDEHNFDASLFNKLLEMKGDDVAYADSDWTSNGDIRTRLFTYTEDNQYDLAVWGVDNALNRLTWFSADYVTDKFGERTLEKVSEDENVEQITVNQVTLSTALDSTLPAIADDANPIVVVHPVKSQNDTIDGDALYNTDVTYEVVVYDPLVNKYASGIDNVTFTATGEDGTTATATVTTDLDNKTITIANGNGMTVSHSGDIKTLACGKDNMYTFHVTLSSAVFNTNEIVLSVTAQDVAEIKGYNDPSKTPVIAIDITKPTVVVSYDNNDVSNGKYFHNLRIATVTVTERNFSDDCLRFIVNGSDRELNFSLAEKGTGNRDNAVWVAQYTFGADQDYTVDVEVQDRAKNVGTVTYVGEAPQEFTIDMINPVITVDYDNHDVLNEIYYKEARIATITIEEHNFSSDDVVIELTAKDDGAVINTPDVSAWASNGDYHTATIRYNYDGEFTFDIDFMDLATNEADDYEMDHFIVDLTAPELEIFDIEHMSANNGVVRPGVRYWDTNYDADGTVVVMTGYNNGVVEMTGSRDITANGVEFKLNDFEYVQEMDDIYTMNATVYDLAGNSSEATVMFSVNRFGSVYTFDKNTDALVGKNGKYYTNKEQQLVITETNVDTLEFKEITLNLNGKLSTLKEGVDFTVGLVGNDTTWKQYTYTLKEENFVEEGTYILTIYSEDRATNTSDNNSKGEKIEFVVDKTNPSLLISGVENEGQYRTTNKEVLIDVEDNVRLSKVVVTVDGVELAVFDADQIDEVNGRLTVGIEAKSDWQIVEVTAYDAAGNVHSHEQMKVLVSANLFVQWYRNTALFYGSIGGTAVVAGLLWWFLVGKKKKKENEGQ